jgi:hypothetical protein
MKARKTPNWKLARNRARRRPVKRLRKPDDIFRSVNRAMRNVHKAEMALFRAIRDVLGRKC